MLRYLGISISEIRRIFVLYSSLSSTDGPYNKLLVNINQSKMLPLLNRLFSFLRFLKDESITVLKYAYISTYIINLHIICK